MTTTAGFQRTQHCPRELGSGIWKLWITQPCKLCQIYRPIPQNFALKLNYIFVEDSWSAFRINSRSVNRDVSDKQGMEVSSETFWSLVILPGAKEIQEGCSLVTQACSSTKTLTNQKRLKKSTVPMAGSHWLSTSHTIPNTLAPPVQVWLPHPKGKHMKHGGTMGALGFHKLSVT